MMSFVRRLRALWLGLLVLALPAAAGEMTRARLEQRFQAPLRVQEKLADVPAWPITSDLAPGEPPIGYVFESIDLAPLPGFAGSPFHLLIAIDRNGKFMDVDVLRQHEPIILNVLGEGTLREFVRQYAGKSLKQEINIGSGQRNSQAPLAGDRVILDGITRATTSVRILNQTVLASALAVARAKLGFTAQDKRAPARARANAFERLTLEQLQKRGAVTRLRLTNAQAERLFAGADGTGADTDGAARPDDTLVELYVAYLNAPTIGRSLLGDAAYAGLIGKLEDGQHALWIATAGRYSMLEDSFTPATVPQRLTLAQDGLPLELRDLVFDLPPVAGAPALNAARVFCVYSGAGLDPGRTMELTLAIVRSVRKGLILPRLVQQPATLRYSPPEALFDYPPRPLPEWLQGWTARWPDLAVIAAALLLLGLVLARPRWLALQPRRLAAFRWSFLAFTLAYLGWYAQGQLSIVQITALLKSLGSGQGVGSLLYDPVSLVVVAFTAVTLVVWGRGAYCGWLCPFGALQEIIGTVARRLSLPQLRISQPRVRQLDWLRYLILAGLILAGLAAPRMGDVLVEEEPFKTAITMGFERDWPFVAYALLLLLASAFYFRFYCRFLCPLGAAMILGGKLRLLAWIPRRDECGRPCRTCRARCAYQAIEVDGKIRYDDCFQCLDCVGTYHDARRCAVLILVRKRSAA